MLLFEPATPEKTYAKSKNHGIQLLLHIINGAQHPRKPMHIINVHRLIFSLYFFWVEDGVGVDVSDDCPES
ncbi:hypothetical protein HanIR_Chr16g0828401 [Helianthus annuus]|nr:hypothetical protein HanIR_Chr16g0828401 [Helianthus annuus]